MAKREADFKNFIELLAGPTPEGRRLAADLLRGHDDLSVFQDEPTEPTPTRTATSSTNVQNGKVTGTTTNPANPIWSDNTVVNVKTTAMRNPSRAGSSSGIQTLRDWFESKPRNASTDKDRRSADGSAKTVFVHAVTAPGGWLRRFDPAQQKIDKNVQLKCTGDEVETAFDVDVSDDGSVGAVLGYGAVSRRYCVTVFDPATYTILARIPFPQNTYTGEGVVISPDAKTAYVLTSDVTTRGANTSILYFIDLIKRTVAATVNISQRLEHIAITPDGARLFLTGSSVDDRLSPIVVMDVLTLTTSNIKMNLTATPTSKAQLSLSPSWIAMHPRGTKLYLIHGGGPLFLLDGTPGGFKVVHPMVVLDTSTGAATVSYPFADDSSSAVAGARSKPQFSPDGAYLLVFGDSLQLSMIDTSNDSVVLRLPRPPVPNGRFITGTTSFFVY